MELDGGFAFVGVDNVITRGRKLTFNKSRQIKGIFHE